MRGRGQTNVATLIRRVGHVVTKYEKMRIESRQRGEGFNVFQLCGVNHYELKNSMVLRELLSPKGMHGLGERPLNAFAKMFNLGTFTTDADVSCEVTGFIKDSSVGRFDIIITDGDKNVCIIENKIHAGEQSEQLERYCKWLRTQNYKRKSLIFLTLDGHKSVTFEEGKGDVKYVRVAYCKKGHKSIMSWLDSCIKMARLKPFVHIPLKQYKKHIQELTNGDCAMNDEVVNALKGHMKAGFKIYEQFEEARRRLISEFLRDNVLGELNSPNNNWAIYNSDDPNGDLGSRTWPSFAFIRRNGKKECMPIWVFVDSGFNECEVGLWHSDLEYITDKKKVDRFKERIKNGLPKEGWSAHDEWLLWKAVRPGNLGSDYGISLDAEFLDNISGSEQSSKKYRDAVAQEISGLIKELQGILDREFSIQS